MNKDIVINIASWKKSGLTYFEYTFCYLVYKKQALHACQLANSEYEGEHTYLKTLEQKGYIKVDYDNRENTEVRQKFLECLVEDVPESKITDVEDWVKDYRNLFAQSGRIGVMGDKSDTLRKMKEFIKTNPEYSKEQIFEATKKYIQSQAPTYRFLMRADYFIEKNDERKNKRSMLGTILEEMYNEDVVQPHDFATDI